MRYKTVFDVAVAMSRRDMTSPAKQRSRDDRMPALPPVGLVCVSGRGGILGLSGLVHAQT